MRWLDSITNAMNMNFGKLWEMVRDREASGTAAHVVAKSWTDWASKQQQQLQLHPLLNQGEGRGGNTTVYQPHKMSVVSILFINIRSLVGL